MLLLSNLFLRLSRIGVSSDAQQFASLELTDEPLKRVMEELNDS
jgi:hypothetical protein